MKINELREELGKHSWWIEEGPGLPQMLLYPLHGFITQANMFHPEKMSINLFVFKNKYWYEISSENEKYEVYQWTFDKMKKDPLFLQRCIETTRQRQKKLFLILDVFENTKNHMNNREIYQSYISFMDEYLKYLEYPVAIECIDVFSAYYLEKEVRDELPFLSGKQVNELILTMSSLKILSFIENERIDFLTILLGYLNGIKKGLINNGLKQRLEMHSAKYFHTQNNYKTIKNLDANYFYERLREESQKDKKNVEKELRSLKNKVYNLQANAEYLRTKYDLSPELLLHFKITETMGESIDNRKDMMLKMNHYINEYCKKIAKRTKVDLDDVHHYSVGEIKDLLLNNKTADPELLKNRKKGFAYVTTRGDINEINVDWFYGDHADEILNLTLPDKNAEIKGQVASAPVKSIIGTAQIIRDASTEFFQKGNILVTSMTRPEFVPLMRKAKAIVTDEGGLTCHAAVVSRELGIPCVIGTKIASKAIKDGSEIEIDLEKGVVREVK
ncbi:MAG: PEP-utilizing enzyme [Candidatus Woesearchaeota archaeon]